MTSLKMSVMQSLTIVGGATNSIFPRVDALLVSGGDWMSSLEFIAGKRTMSRYRSMVDFLFCELNPEWRFSCRRFYRGDGKSLHSLISAEEVRVHEHQMLLALEVAVEAFRERRRQSWREFRVEVEERVYLAS